MRYDRISGASWIFQSIRSTFAFTQPVVVQHVASYFIAAAALLVYPLTTTSAQTRGSGGETSAHAFDISSTVDSIQSFAHYDTPGQCAAAVARTAFRVYRERVADTLRYTPTSDTVPTLTVQLAQTCYTTFGSTQLPERELLNLARLALYANEDTLAKSVLERWIHAAATNPVRVRADRLLSAIQTVLTAHPARPSIAHTFASLLDSLGDSAAIWRLQSAVAFRNYATRAFDIPTIYSQSEKMVAISKTLSESDREEWAGLIINGYLSLANAAMLTRGPAAALPVFEDATKNMGSIRPEAQALLDSYRERLSHYGKPAPPLEGKYWFGTSSRVRPAPNTVSLLVFLTPSCQQCLPGYAVLRRLAQKYAAPENQGALEITLVAQTRGYYRLHVLPSPDAEADTLRAYFLDRLRLPGALVVAESEIQQLPDGRRIPQKSTNFVKYSAQELENYCVLIDRSGNVYAISDVSVHNEALLEGLIQLLLRGNDGRGAGIEQSSVNQGNTTR